MLTMAVALTHAHRDELWRSDWGSKPSVDSHRSGRRIVLGVVDIPEGDGKRLEGRAAVQCACGRGTIGMTKRSPKRDEKREHRISMEIVVDAYGEDERAMGWYYYLEERLRFPFDATCIVKREISPLRVKDLVEVIRMPSADECAREMFVTIRWQKDGLAVPLSQLKPTSNVDEKTRQTVQDWHYWVAMDYEF